MREKAFAAVVLAATVAIAATTASAQQNNQQTVQGWRAPALPIFVSPATVREAQVALSEAGFDPGSINGIWGPEASEAVTSFQQANGLEATGNLNLQTITTLGLSNFCSGARNPQVNQRLSAEALSRGGTLLFVSPTTVRDVALALARSGYSSGNVSGPCQPQFTQALLNFQQAQRLEPTGTITPTTLLALGLRARLYALSRDRIQPVPGNIQPIVHQCSSGPGLPLTLGPAGLRQVQAALDRTGFGGGSMSGIWDGYMRNALVNFQQSVGLEPTGNINLRTLCALGLGGIFAGPYDGIQAGNGGMGAARQEHDLAEGYGLAPARP